MEYTLTKNGVFRLQLKFSKGKRLRLFQFPSGKTSKAWVQRQAWINILKSKSRSHTQMAQSIYLTSLCLFKVEKSDRGAVFFLGGGAADDAL